MSRLGAWPDCSQYFCTSKKSFRKPSSETLPYHPLLAPLCASAEQRHEQQLNELSGRCRCTSGWDPPTRLSPQPLLTLSPRRSQRTGLSSNGDNLNSIYLIYLNGRDATALPRAFLRSCSAAIVLTSVQWLVSPLVLLATELMRTRFALTRSSTRILENVE